MDLRVIEYFLTVAQEGSISRAAQLLHVSQPTISRQLMDLEDELGRTLFLRTNRRVILTENGELFRETAKDMLRLYEKARSENMYEKELRGEIRIAAAEIESFDFLAEKIVSFHKKNPGVTFHLDACNAEEACEAIDKGTADLAFILKSVSTMKYELADLHMSERWGILISRNHRLAQRTSVTVSDLTGEKLIVPETDRFRNDIREWFGDACHIACTYNLVKNAMILSENSDLVTICLEMERYIDEKLIFVPLESERRAAIFLVWKKQITLSSALKAFLSCFDIQKTND